MSILRNAVKAIFGAPKPIATKSEQTANAVPLDLQNLDRVETGLAARATAYIAGTGDGSVLPILAFHQKGVLLGGCQASRQSKPGCSARREMLIDPRSTLDLVVRYCEVLAADQNPIRVNQMPSTAAVPFAVRIFLLEIWYATKIQKTDGAPLAEMTNERALAVVTALGGSIEDLFDVAFFKEKKWPYPNGNELDHVLDLAGLVRSYPDAFVAQNDRLPVLGRIKLLDHIAAHRLHDIAVIKQMVVDALGDSSKLIREEALKGFAEWPPETRESLAIELLAQGNAHMRSSMVEALTGLDQDRASDILQTHLKTEKTARIRTQIEAYLTAAEGSPEAGEETEQSSDSYQAMDGSIVAIPPVRVPEDGPALEITDDIRRVLLALGKELEDQYQSDLKENNQPSGRSRHYYLKYAAPVPPQVFARQAELLLTDQGFDSDCPRDVHRRIGLEASTNVFRNILAEFAPKPALDLSLRNLRGDIQRINPYTIRTSLWAATVADYLTAANGDYRYLDMAARSFGSTRKFNKDEGREDRPMRAGEQLYYHFMSERHWRQRLEDPIGNGAIWPLVAENLWLVDRALGIVADPEFPEAITGGLEMLETLPKVPAKYGPTLLNLAISGPKAVQKKARMLLNRNDGFDTLLTAMIEDSRQDVRAGAAKWIAERGSADAIAPLKKRLKKEKSPTAKAAMVFALQALDQDVSAFIGPKALLAEAEKNLPKANFKAVDWLDFERLPSVHYKGGAAVPGDVLKWWIALAVKLKAPGEADLFELYLDQLKPKDAATLSTWIFDSWYGFDCGPPTESTVEASALRMFQQMGTMWKYYYPENVDATDAEKMEIFRRRARTETPNSGAASKGLLALSGKMAPAHGVAKVRSYLRKHGGRTSQTTAMLELMAAMGDPMSLQVVIAAATRLRQKGVQKRANELIQIVADRNEWTLDQLADRTVPTGGLEDDGRMELPCSGGEKIYVAQLDEKLGLTLFNPDGKVIKSLPAGQDDETKAAKKALAAAKKEIKQAIAFQTARLFEAMCSNRTWLVEDFQCDFIGHPLMRKLVERLIWQGLDAQGGALGTFRPTAEGEMINASDQDVDLSGFATLRLAHASTVDEGQAAQWRQHMKDYEVKPLFDQVRKDLPSLTDDMRAQTEIDDRKGWVTDCFTIRSAAKRAGYERGDILDSGGFQTYTRHFSGVGIVAVIEFTGSGVPEQNWPAAYKTLYFERLAMGQSRGYGSGSKLRFDKVPPVLLAECWADLHSIAKNASYDPDWETVGPW